MKPILYISAIILVLGLTACERFKHKGQTLANEAETTLKNKSDDFIDKVMPRFDAYLADTKYNKKRFKEFLEVELTPDVKNIYCFDDAIGIDADYQFVFNCNAATAQRIIEKQQLKLDKETSDYAFGLQNDFKWWNKAKIATLDLYSWQGEHQYFKYFWYDKVEQKAYYFEFDM